jgi:hypothetical protein
VHSTKYLGESFDCEFDAVLSLAYFCQQYFRFG